MNEVEEKLWNRIEKYNIAFMMAEGDIKMRTFYIVNKI